MLSRKRLACTACTRRKVKCDKTIPCSNCVRRGLEAACTRDVNDTPAPQETRELWTPIPATRHESPTKTIRASDLDALMRRMADLERQIQLGTDNLGRSGNGRPTDRGAQALQSPLSSNTGEQSLSPPSRQLSVISEPKTSAISPTPTISGQSFEIEDVGTTLEFLAWGRRKNPASNPRPDIAASNIVEDVADALVDSLEMGTSSQLSLLQLLIPDHQLMWQLVDYHEKCLLWYHGSYFAPTFRRQLEEFQRVYKGSIEQSGVDLQWAALLFSILTGAITCAPTQQIQAWGFRDAEREVLCKKWYRAVMLCLELSEYATYHTISSVQAIATLTLSAHLLGFSNKQSLLLASAVRIAQSLGLHCISNDTPGSLVDKEIGRRVWQQLCTQDWFGIFFSETYLINPLYSQSGPPRNCHDDDLIELPESVPTITSYPRGINAVASVIVQLQDAVTASKTPYTKYQQVLHFDKRIRGLMTTERPPFLNDGIADSCCPIYIPWARRAMTMSCNHKIIMAHRKFLGLSFINPTLAFTRHSCLTAAKAIIREYRLVVENGSPTMWFHQAFSVAACIIVCLELLHGDHDDRGYIDLRRMAEEVIDILRLVGNSTFAARSVKLLSALLEEASRVQYDTTIIASSQERQLQQRPLSNKRRADGMYIHTPDTPPASVSSIRVGTKTQRRFDVRSFVKTFCDELAVTSSRTRSVLGQPHSTEGQREAEVTRRTPTGPTASTTAPSSSSTNRRMSSAIAEETNPPFVPPSNPTNRSTPPVLAATASSRRPQGHLQNLSATMSTVDLSSESTTRIVNMSSFSMPTEVYSQTLYGSQMYEDGNNSGNVGDMGSLNVNDYSQLGFETVNPFEELMFLANREIPMY